MSVHLFLISADPSLTAAAARAVTGLPIQLQTAQSLAQAEALLPSPNARTPFVLLVDLIQGDYLRTRQWIQRQAPRARVFFIAAQAEEGAWSQGGQSAPVSRGGAEAPHLFPRPVGARDSAELFGRILAEATSLAEANGGIAGFDDLVGRSVAFRSALDQALKVADREEPVLLLGEEGSGRRFFARAIHAESARRERGFLSLRAATLAPGALAGLPGAPDSRAGRLAWRDALGGTLYIEDVTALDPNLQRQLVAYLDAARLIRAQRLERADQIVRILAGSSRDVAAEVAAGRFAPDLHQRLRTHEIRIPPLRERPSDILLMAEHFLQHAVPRLQGRQPALTAAAKERLVSHAWPGNVRELIGTLQIACLNAGESAEIDSAHLPDAILSPARKVSPPALEAEGAVAAGAAGAPEEGEAGIRLADPSRATRFSNGQIVIELPEAGIAFDDLERAILRAAMARTRGNVVRAARLLRLGRGSLRYRLEKHGIVQPKRRRSARRAGTRRQDAA